MKDMLSNKRNFDNYGNMLIGWSKLPLKRNVTLDVGSSNRIKLFMPSAGFYAKQSIKKNFGWVINDGGGRPLIFQTSDEITANANLSGKQDQADITQLTNGSILVSWTSNSRVGQASPAGTDIMGRLFNSLGTPIKGDFRLNHAITDTNESNSSVAALPDGGFVVAYESSGFIGIEVFDALGNLEVSTKTDPQFLVAWTSHPEVSVNADGTVLLTYQTRSQTFLLVAINMQFNTVAQTFDPTTGGFGLPAHLYSSNATMHSGISVPDYFNSIDLNINSTSLEGDRFGVAYKHITNIYSNQARALYFSIVDPRGLLDVATGLTTHFIEHQVGASSGKARKVNSSAIKALDNGDFVIVWSNRDQRDMDIHFQRYTSNGEELGFVVDVGDEGADDSHYKPKIVALTDGGFVIFWVDLDDETIKMQRYNPEGLEVGSVKAASSGKGSFTVQLLKGGRIAIASETPGGQGALRQIT